MEDCPAVLSLGTLCGKQGWSYEWKNGDHPTMTKGSTSITLTPHHDVPMIFSAKKSESPEDSTADPSSSRSCEGRPYAEDSGGQPPTEAEEPSQSSTTTSQETSTTAPSQSSSDEGSTQERRTGRIKKQRLVKSKYAKAPSARHNLYTHFLQIQTARYAK